MSCCCCITALLLLLVAVTEAQSGDGDTETEPRISCTSDLMAGGSSLTCKLVGRQSNNEDDEDNDDIKNMTVCYNYYWPESRMKCEREVGDTVRNLDPLININVTVHLKTGNMITSQIDLKKIVKPRSPQVSNVTFNHESNQAVFHIQIPYHNEYLKIDNQLFQLLIWTSGTSTIQNISSVDTLEINMEHLKRNTEYHVKVRAIPQEYLQGTWSEWSKPSSFFTPAETNLQQQTDERVQTYTLTVCLILLVVVTSSIVFFWKNKIFTYMWPSVPHPKHTLVQICKPNKGLLLNFKPEVFSALKVCPIEKTKEQPCEDTKPSISAAAEDTESDHLFSIQSSDCRSTTRVSTEELSTLLSRSSSDGEDSLQATGPSPINFPQLEERSLTPEAEHSRGGNEAEVFGMGQQEEAYVTMSSFYQIK